MEKVSVKEAVAGALGGITPANLLSALIFLIVSLLIIKILLKVFEKAFSKTKMASKTSKFILGAIKVVLYFFAFAMVFQTLGIDLTAVVSVMSALSLGLTIAAESIIANVAGGAVVMATKPFKVGDIIEVNGLSGAVESIRLNNTELHTVQGTTIIIPNKTMSTSNIVNYSALGQRRVDIQVSASYDMPTEKVLKALYEAAANVPEVLKDPAPAAFLAEFGGSAINYSLFMWTKTEDYLTVMAAINGKVREAFKANGVEMSYQRMIVHMQ